MVLQIDSWCCVPSCRLIVLSYHKQGLLLTYQLNGIICIDWCIQFLFFGIQNINNILIIVIKKINICRHPGRP